MGEQHIIDASGAQLAARRHLEAEHKSKLGEVKIRKCWYSTGARKDVWDVEGIVIIKKRLFRKEQRHFKYQIDPTSGSIIGFAE